MFVLLTGLRDGSWLTAERIRNYSLMLAIAGLVSLAAIWCSGASGMTDRFGRPIGTDFSGVWTAGRLVLMGQPQNVFDPTLHFEFQRAVFANRNIDVYGWHYPPYFLALATLLATMPYVPALLIWQGATFALFARTISQIAPSNNLVMVATIGFPAVFVTLGHGHNSFLTASLLGTGLVLLERRPVIAGIAIGLLAYKPQFGVVLPLVLIAGHHWRAAFCATITVAAMTLATVVSMGTDVWIAFFEAASFTRTVVLEQGNTGWHKIQSLFAAVRSFGGSLPLAYALQGLLTIAVLLALTTAILRRADHRLIKSATATAALLATPYCLDYDLAILGISIAFSLHYAAQHGFAPFEKTLLATVWLVPLVARTGMAATGVPIGVLVMGVFFAFVMSRALASAETASKSERTLAYG
jgi:alpha-1,2-mannosyltransferase